MCPGSLIHPDPPHKAETQSPEMGYDPSEGFLQNFMPLCSRCSACQELSAGQAQFQQPAIGNAAWGRAQCRHLRSPGEVSSASERSRQSTLTGKAEPVPPLCGRLRMAEGMCGIISVRLTLSNA